MSDTPLADALKDQYCMSHLVWYNLCGELERELAALREDKARMDWLEKARPIAWALGSAQSGEYWLLTDIGEKHPEEAEEFATLRAAIDAARKEAQP